MTCTYVPKSKISSGPCLMILFVMSNINVYWSWSIPRRFISLEWEQKMFLFLKIRLIKITCIPSIRAVKIALSASSVNTACSRECIASVYSIYHQLWLDIHIKCGNFSLKDFRGLDGYIIIWCWSQLLSWDWKPNYVFHINRGTSCPRDDGSLSLMFCWQQCRQCWSSEIC